MEATIVRTSTDTDADTSSTDMELEIATDQLLLIKVHIWDEESVLHDLYVEHEKEFDEELKAIGHEMFGPIDTFFGFSHPGGVWIYYAVPSPQPGRSPHSSGVQRRYESESPRKFNLSKLRERLFSGVKRLSSKLRPARRALRFIMHMAWAVLKVGSFLATAYTQGVMFFTGVASAQALSSLHDSLARHFHSWISQLWGQRAWGTA
jgi:hypothetical protein